MGVGALAGHLRIKFRCQVLVFLAFASVLVAQNSKPPDPQLSRLLASSAYVPVHKYDPSRNAAADISDALAEGQRTGKRILIEIGGDWCPWCHLLDQFYLEHRDILELRDKNFVTVCVYYNAGHKNEAALSRYSKILGIPHMFVLEKDGTLLHSQHVVELETSDAYDVAKVRGFLLKWSPRAGSLANTDSNAANPPETSPAATLPK